MGTHTNLYLLLDIDSIKLLFIFFGLLLYVPVNSYGHVGTVSSPNHTFFLGNLEQAVNHYFMHILLLVTDNNPSWMNQGKSIKLRKLMKSEVPKS